MAKGRAIDCRVCSISSAVLFFLLVAPVLAGPFAAPGDLRLRHDVQLLGDAGLIDAPLTTWPLAWSDIANAMAEIDALALNNAELAAYERLRSAVRVATRTGEVAYRLGVGGAATPREIRTFEDTPREEGQVSVGLEWTGNRFAAELNATYAGSPNDDDSLRPDGSFVGAALGNWAVTAGWQERWWGPGRDGSLILSTNARPVPAVSLQRNRSEPFESRWLRWIGPWTLVTFIGQLDDDRVVNDALLFGLRFAFRPISSLEIGVSRTAQWCGDDRPCTGSTFVDLLLGNDNRGVNVSAEDEPGNQLGGVDVRWSLPGDIPLALYAQWIGEDTRNGGPEIGSWLRMAGIEHRGGSGTLSHRTHFEVAETSCRDGGLGFSGLDDDCAYENGIYQTGYRYRGRSIGHGIDGDGLSYSLGTTLVQSAGQAWSAVVRSLDVNRVGQPSIRHTLSAVPQDRLDVQVSHQRDTRWGILHIGAGYRHVEDEPTGNQDNEVTAFIQWSTQ